MLVVQIPIGLKCMDPNGFELWKITKTNLPRFEQLESRGILCKNRPSLFPFRHEIMLDL